MNSIKSGLGILSLVLLLPGLFLSANGILYAVFGLEAANRLLEGLMAHPVFRVLLSPFVVLGGPLVAFGVNARKVFHLSADVVHEEFVIALSVKRLFGNLLIVVLSVGLVGLLVSYAFVENFKIVAR